MESEGLCSSCGKPLPPNWHADHIIPFSFGGRTDVVNGQALCPDCNIRKGDSYLDDLRKWQKIALKKWITHDSDTFLCVACPGAGKTTFALACANYFLQNKNNFIILVCHTKHLKLQWSQAASKVGIQLEYIDSGSLKEMNGICTTYQTLQRDPDWFRKRASRQKTLVIFDEIHHLGEGKQWGTSAIEAFGDNGLKLALSGTPIRSGNEKIPFIKYRDIVTSDGMYGKEAIADYSYRYVQSLQDKVCRNVFFPRFNGEMEWIGRDLQKYCCTFTDEIPEGQESERLRTALDPGGTWLLQTLTDANERLDSIRNAGHENAGGIVFARDSISSHAQEIYKMLVDITGNSNMVDIVTSEEPGSSETIKAFAENNKKWIVSVRMISEGVDIPRLRVGVHATNWITELFFRQAVGRICRYQADVDDNINQASFYYIPADERLIGYAESIRKDVNHIIEEEDEDEGPGPGPGVPRQVSLYEPINSSGFEDGVISDTGHTYTKEELYHARYILQEIGCTVNQDMMLVEALRVHEQSKTKDVFQRDKVKHIHNKSEKKAKLRQSIHKKVGRIAKKYDLDYQAVHNKLNNVVGCNTKGMTEDQLVFKLELACKWESTGEL